MSRLLVAVCFYTLLLAAFGGLTFAVIPHPTDAVPPVQPAVPLAEYPLASRPHIALRQGNLGVAIAADTELIQLTGNANWYHHRGLVYERAGQLEQALADLTETVRLQPYWVGARQDRARLCLRLKDYRGAIDDYTACIGQGPPEDSMFQNRALAYLLAGQPDQAVADCTSLIARIAQFGNQNRTATAHRDRSACYRLIGKIKEAVEDATQATRLDPADWKNHAERAKAHLRGGDFVNAIADTDEAIRLPHCTDAVYDLRGRAYVGAKRYKDAIESFTRALEANPRPDYYAHRGQAYQALGMTERAARDTERSEVIRKNAPAPAGPVFGPITANWLDDTVCAFDD